MRIQDFRFFIPPFSLASVVAELLSICEFSLNKRCETYLESILPPGVKIWQLIYPDSKDSRSVVIFFLDLVAAEL